MDFRNPILIEEELNDVKELIKLNEELLSQFDDEDDPALEFNLEYLKEIKRDLIDELNRSNDFYNIDLFDVVIKENHDEMILLNDFVDISRSFQNLIFPLAQAAEGKPVQLNESIENRIIEGATLGLVEVSSGSLRMILKTDPQTRFSSFVKIAFDKLNDLIDCEDNESLLIQQTEKLGPECMKRYKNFMGAISRKEVDIVLFDELKPASYKTTNISNEFAMSVYNVIGVKQDPTEEKMIIEGVLGVIDTFHYYLIIEDSNKHRIKVFFEKSLTNKISRQLEREVRIEINIIKSYHELEDRFDERREFIRFFD